MWIDSSALRQAVVDDGGMDQRGVVFLNAAAREQLAPARERLNLLHRVAAVAVAHAVVRAREVVEIHGSSHCPWRVLLGEQPRRGSKVAEWKRNRGNHSSSSHSQM